MKKAKKVKRQPYYCEVRGSWIIPLTQGRETLVDAEDVEFLGKFNWIWCQRGTKIGYAELPRTQGAIHRVILGQPKGLMVDHINGNSLDNRRKNLRAVSNRENQLNRQSHRSGRLCGTCYVKSSRKWQSSIKIDGSQKHLGVFKTEHEAHESYMKAYNELITKEKSAA